MNRMTENVAVLTLTLANDRIEELERIESDLRARVAELEEAARRQHGSAAQAVAWKVGLDVFLTYEQAAANVRNPDLVPQPLFRAPPVADAEGVLTEKDWLNIKVAMVHLKEAKFHTASDNLRAILPRSPAAAAEVTQSEFDRGFLAGRACKVERPGPAGKIIAAEQPAAEPELMPLPEWLTRTDKGNLIPRAQVIEAMHAYARAHLRAAGQDSERLDAVRWRAFRNRDYFDDLNYEHFFNKYREDADEIVDAAMKAGAQGGGK